LRIAITGGTGTFGECCTRILLERGHKVKVISRGEFRQWEMGQSLKAEYCIGDTRDRERMFQLLNVDLVIHAAALKQVPVCETQPQEAVKTEILGSQNVIDACLRHGAKLMAISTDKACKPVNLYGATKMVMEKLVTSAGYSCCRYGNVIGSRGSLIDLIRRVDKVPLTHPDMTRFWIRIDDGVKWVLDMIDRMDGEIFVPKMPSMKIIDVIKAFDKDYYITGIRPGEKLHECLIAPEEHSKEFDNYYAIKSEYPIGIEFTSGNNKEWLTKERLLELCS